MDRQWEMKIFVPFASHIATFHSCLFFFFLFFLTSAKLIFPVWGQFSFVQDQLIFTRIISVIHTVFPFYLMRAVLLECPQLEICQSRD